MYASFLSMRVIVWSLGGLSFLSAYLELNVNTMKFVFETIVVQLPLTDCRSFEFQWPARVNAQIFTWSYMLAYKSVYACGFIYLFEEVVQLYSLQNKLQSSPCI